MIAPLYEVQLTNGMTEGNDEWQKLVSQFRPRDLVEWLSAPKRTVMDWRSGHSSPPAWLQPIIRAHILACAADSGYLAEDEPNHRAMSGYLDTPPEQ